MSYLPNFAGLGQSVVTKTLTFSNDAAGQVNLFTVTGDVIVKVVPVCTTNIASAAAGNITMGAVGDLDAMIGTTLGTDIDAREIWIDATPDSEIEAFATIRDYIITDGNDIQLDLDAQIDSGVIAFYCFWTPLSSDGNVVAA